MEGSVGVGGTGVSGVDYRGKRGGFFFASVVEEEVEGVVASVVVPLASEIASVVAIIAAVQWRWMGRKTKRKRSPRGGSSGNLWWEKKPLVRHP